MTTSEPAGRPSTGATSRSPRACGAVALAAYVRTLAPGLTSDLDSPMFQFIGRVLGVAHNPGYPLYTLVTWPVAQVPIGELAWRINLFSAVMGAVATGARLPRGAPARAAADRQPRRRRSASPPARRSGRRR